MRVLHIFSGFGGGISSLILNLVENRNENFIFDTLAFSYKGGEQFCQRIQNQGGKCYTMPRFKKRGFHVFFKYLNKLLESNEYDVVHCHISGWIARMFYKVAKKHGCEKFIVHAHTTLYDSRLDRLSLMQKLNQKINYKIATEYMTCSDLAANYIFGEKYLKKKKCTLIPNGMKEELFSHVITNEDKDNYRNEFEIPDGVKVILHVGRFSTPKNHEGILAISEQLKRKGSAFVMVLIGDGERFDEIKQYVKEHKLEDIMRLPGRRSDISKLMQWADIMILPSHYEGLPTVAVECQATGTPIIISDVVTPQCDMGLDLVRFANKDNTKQWVDIIENMASKKLNVKCCIEKIRTNGFTAQEAGKYYCSVLEQLSTDI